MNYAKMVACFHVGLILGMPVSKVVADDQEKKPARQIVEEEKKVRAVFVAEAQDRKPEPAAAVPLYKPPKRSAPGGRVVGGTRGPEHEVVVLSVLAPDHTGLTVKEQPSLYWLMSNPTSAPVELTVVDPRTTEPLLETRILPPLQPGIHRIRLADQGIRLARGVAYRWYVAIVPDPTRRSKDILAGGIVERIEPPEGLSAQLAQADKESAVYIYAGAGLWYDAFEAISELAESAPHDPVLGKQRASLMAQVGLPEIKE